MQYLEQWPYPAPPHVVGPPAQLGRHGVRQGGAAVIGLGIGFRAASKTLVILGSGRRAVLGQHLGDLLGDQAGVRIGDVGHVDHIEKVGERARRR